MGTRAIITKNGKEFIATHWDGYPDGLGRDLLGNKTDDEIIKVAEQHSIDCADKDILSEVNKQRYEEIAKKTKGKYSVKDIAELHKKGQVIVFGAMASSDYPIEDIKLYGDHAEYQYDLKDGKWRFRSIYGSWHEADKTGHFRDLENFLKSK